MCRIFITGMGVISSLGNSAGENRSALMNGRCGITHPELVNTKYSNLPCGEIKISTEDLQERLQVTAPGVTRTSLLALHAFEEATKDAGLSLGILSSHQTAVIGGSTVGGMCLTDELYRDAQNGIGFSPYLSSYDCSSVTMFLQQRHNLSGLVNTINTACSSSANAILFGARLIKSGRVRRAIVGGVDSLAKFTINGFNALHILSSNICRPFDVERQGLNLGEGAAFLVLEKEEDLGGKRVYGELTGYCNASDAFHPSSLSSEGDGPFLAMKGALEVAEILPGDIGFINAHGTGTENNDEVESIAMRRLFKTLPPFTSTKSNTGHTLGAAGAVEAVYSMLNLTHQEIYPSLNFSSPIVATGFKPTTEYKQIPLRHVMSNSFGFGGNCTSLVFSKA